MSFPVDKFVSDLSFSNANSKHRNVFFSHKHPFLGRCERVGPFLKCAFLSRARSDEDNCYCRICSTIRGLICSVTQCYGYVRLQKRGVPKIYNNDIFLLRIYKATLLDVMYFSFRPKLPIYNTHVPVGPTTENIGRIGQCLFDFQNKSIRLTQLVITTISKVCNVINTFCFFFLFMLLFLASYLLIVVASTL